MSDKRNFEFFCRFWSHDLAAADDITAKFYYSMSIGG